MISCVSAGEKARYPQGMRNVKTVTLYKNMQGCTRHNVCKSYGGIISLLNIVGKVFARLFLTRLQVLADRIYPESQC